MPTPYQTPGVYINEINAFPNSIVPVATAIPVFIGYTASASYNGQSYVDKPVQINSLSEFMLYFGLSDPSTGLALPDLQQYRPVYYPTPSQTPQTADLTMDGKAYDVEPDPGTVYYLYNSIKLFYQNGGGTCYVISVGPYGPILRGTGKAKTEPLINPNIDVTRLTAALALLEEAPDATIIVVPDATLLSAADTTSLNGQILECCLKAQSCVAVFDIPGGASPNPTTWLADDITPFRTNIGTNGLNYGIAYYPFLNTAVMTNADINYDNLGGAKTLSATLPGASTAPLATLIESIGQTEAGASTPLQIDNALLTASADYQNLRNIALAKMNILPPSSAIAGLYTMVDNTCGVWRAPANFSLVSVTNTTLQINDTMQGSLNVDPVTGKSINAIRMFPGQGPLVWGARTLDGNSMDWRYVSVRRTMIMLEQSIKQACQNYVFAPNTPNTWSLVTSMITSFLTSMWSQGALAGSTPGAAFKVACGLGTSMTSEDILNGVMNVEVQVAVSHPAEFIAITISQEMQTS